MSSQASSPRTAERVAGHRVRQGANWRPLEEPLKLASALRQADATSAVVLVECLTLWLTSLLARPGPAP
jgi:adenosylcobinamide kinase/adenosylcobinamide-phosphate guanylyltransferase